MLIIFYFGTYFEYYVNRCAYALPTSMFLFVNLQGYIMRKIALAALVALGLSSTVFAEEAVVAAGAEGASATAAGAAATSSIVAGALAVAVVAVAAASDSDGTTGTDGTTN